MTQHPRSSDQDKDRLSKMVEWIHVPTPGDHYSPSTGSAIMTLAYEIGRVHVGCGGESSVVVSEGTRQDYPVGRCVEVPKSRILHRRLKAFDALCGRFGLFRPFVKGIYKPHNDAISESFNGVIFLHNAPDVIPMFKRRHPMAKVCLWANNHLFRTHSDMEVRRIARYADHLICCSEYIAQLLRRKLGGRSVNKVAVIHNGVDTVRFAPFDTPKNQPPVVLFVGRVHQTKGPDLLIKAAVELVRRGVTGFKLRIIGSSGFSANDPLSPFEASLRELALPIQKMVEFVPFRDRDAVLGEYMSASVFCVPSNWDDPCPLTVMEGMACGLPVVASHRGGIPEQGGDDIFYFKPPDINQLADFLAPLLNDPQMRLDAGKSARRRSCEFSWKEQYQKLWKVLNP